MLVLCDLLKIIKITQYAQNTIKCDVNFKKKCYVMLRSDILAAFIVLVETSIRKTK